MASVAAATSRGRCRRHEQQVKQRALRRARIACEREELKGQADYIFEELSRDGEWLQESQLRAFFVGVFHTRNLDPNALQLVLDTAHKRQEEESLTQDNDADRISQGDLQRHALVESVIKYHEYMGNRKVIEESFEKYDRAGHGKLGISELQRLLQDKERKEHRAAKGVVITLVVSPKDLEYILQEADVDRDGLISRAELLPAVACWDGLARLKMEQKQQMASCCIIL